jgi:hypothetical protein
MPRPPVSIQLSLADPFTTPDFTEIAPLVQSLTGGGRGKQRETDKFEPGTVSLLLNNRDGRFSTFNENGPYYNFITADDASQDASLGTWAAVSGCTVALAAVPVVLDGPNGIQVTST